MKFFLGTKIKNQKKKKKWPHATLLNESTFFYLGPIRTNESQRAINKEKLDQMTFLGLLICKQTFSKNVAKFRLTESLLVPQPSTYE